VETLNRICKWLFFVVLLILLLFGAFYYIGFNSMIAPRANIVSRLQTTVTVFEGVVDFYRIKSNGKFEFQRAIKKGEVGQMRKVLNPEALGLRRRQPGAPMARPGSVEAFYNALAEIFPKVTNTFMGYMDDKIKEETSANGAPSSGTFTTRVNEDDDSRERRRA
jgi:hypothetical protein